MEIIFASYFYSSLLIDFRYRIRHHKHPNYIVMTRSNWKVNTRFDYESSFSAINQVLLLIQYLKVLSLILTTLPDFAFATPSHWQLDLRWKSGKNEKYWETWFGIAFFSRPPSIRAQWSTERNRIPQGGSSLQGKKFTGRGCCCAQNY